MVDIFENLGIIDVDENDIVQISEELMAILLRDRTSGKNIIWASDYYMKHGDKYGPTCQITVNSITERKNKVIKPRTCKSKSDQLKRSRDVAEVFTPSWVCNNQINLIDRAWLGYDDAFNYGSENTKWKTNYNPILFNNRQWTDYVSDVRLEITCGEAPYLVSRYDTVSGDFIEVIDRIGILDRKIRVVNENCTDETWYEWVKIAFQSVYGYDLQGDNVILSRENLLLSFIDYYKDRFKNDPPNDMMLEIANIISWNIWQMDGMKYVVPYSCESKKVIQINLFGEKIESEKHCVGCEKNDPKKHNGVYCKIKDWKLNKTVKYVDMVKK